MIFIRPTHGWLDRAGQTEKGPPVLFQDNAPDEFCSNCQDMLFLNK